MRCYACNVILSDFEATRRSPGGDYLDTCISCWRVVDPEGSLPTIDRKDLMHEDDDKDPTEWMGNLLLLGDNQIIEYNNHIEDE